MALRELMKHQNYFIRKRDKFFEIEIDETDQIIAEKKVEEMCQKLLVNLIIEDYKINILK